MDEVTEHSNDIKDLVISETKIFLDAKEVSKRVGDNL